MPNRRDKRRKRRASIEMEFGFMITHATPPATVALMERIRHYRAGADHRAAATLMSGPRTPLGGVSGITQIGGA